MVDVERLISCWNDLPPPPVEVEGFQLMTAISIECEGGGDDSIAELGLQDSFSFGVDLMESFYSVNKGMDGIEFSAMKHVHLLAMEDLKSRLHFMMTTTTPLKVMPHQPLTNNGQFIGLIDRSADHA